MVDHLAPVRRSMHRPIRSSALKSLCPAADSDAVLMDATLYHAVELQLATCEEYETTAHKTLEEQRGVDDKRLRGVVEVMGAEADKRAAEAARDAGGVPTWEVIAWSAGAGVGGFLIGVVVAFLSTSSGGVVVVE